MSKRRDEFESQWRARFDRYARLREDDAGIAGWSATGLAARVRRFLGLLARTPGLGSRCVDVGCGAGTYSRLLAQNGVQVFAIDYSPETIRKARDRGADGIDWCVGDARRLPLAGESMDGALCFGVTQALSASEEVVGELSRVVRHRGYVWLDGLNRWCIPHALERVLRRLRGRPDHLRYESPWRMARLMRRCGLGQVRIHWVPILPGRLHWAQPLVEAGWFQKLLAAIPPAGALLSHAFILVGQKRRT